MEHDDTLHDIIMIGAGPSALAAAVYTTREDLDTVLLEKGIVGGLAATTDWVDNYPGFADGIEGLKLAEQLEAQAKRFGADIRIRKGLCLPPRQAECQLGTASNDPEHGFALGGRQLFVRGLGECDNPRIHCLARDEQASRRDGHG